MADDRMADNSVRNLVNCSMPPVWTAGKMGDWGLDARLTAS
ncbi:MAG: hypothetical protein R2748_08015 [Bryobacterales bacterium]